MARDDHDDDDGDDDDGPEGGDVGGDDAAGAAKVEEAADDDDTGAATRTATRTRTSKRRGGGKGGAVAQSARKGGKDEDDDGSGGRVERRGRGRGGPTGGAKGVGGGGGDEEEDVAADVVVVAEGGNEDASAGDGGGDGDGVKTGTTTAAADAASEPRKGRRKVGGGATPSPTKNDRKGGGAVAAAVAGRGIGGGKRKRGGGGGGDESPSPSPSSKGRRRRASPGPAKPATSTSTSTSTSTRPGVRRGTRTRTPTRRLAEEGRRGGDREEEEEGENSSEDDDDDDGDGDGDGGGGGSESDDGEAESEGPVEGGGDGAAGGDGKDGGGGGPDGHSGGKKKRPRNAPPDDDEKPPDAKAAAAKSTTAAAKKSSTTKRKSKTPRRSRRKGGAAKRGKGRNRGSLKNRTCPYCSKVYSSLHGLAYHIKHRVCKREADEMAAFGNTKGKRNSPAAQASRKSAFPAIFPGARFVTPYGVVQVVSDSRAPDDHGATAPAKRSVSRAKRRSAQRLREDASQWRRMALRQVAFHRTRRARLRELYWKGGQWGIDEAVAAREQGETVPGGGGQPDGRKPFGDEVVRKVQEPPDVPRDSYPGRIVECIMVPDTRKRIGSLDQEDDSDNMMKAATCVAVVTEALAESKRKDYKKVGEGGSNDDNGGFRVFLRRRLLTTLYNPDIPLYTCTKCGKHFNSKVGLIGHIDAKVCTKHRDVRDIFAYEKQEERAEEERRVQALMASMERSRSRPSSGSSKAVYREAMRSLGFIYSNDRRAARKRREIINYAKMVVDDEVKSVDSDEDEAFVLEASENEYDTLNAKQSMPPNRPVVIGASKKKCDKSNAEKSWPPKRVTGANPTNLPNRQAPKVVDSMVDLVKEIDSGKYKSMQRYHGEHSNVCAVFGCKFETTLYCCEFCSNIEHVECLKKKVILNDFRPGEEDFVCHTCVQSVLACKRRYRRRLERKEEQRKKAGANVPGTPVAAKAAGDDAMKRTVHHSNATGNKNIHKIRGKTALKFNPSRCAAYPEVLKSLSLSYTLKKALNTRVKQRKRSKPVGGDVAHNDHQDGKNQQHFAATTTVSKPSAVAPKVIDTMVLVEEVDAGRYPSMKRFNGDYEENCVLCDKGTGELYGCGFCANVSHVKCIKERFTIREIEDDDDFMCHRCIGVILARRARAEKRRIQKRDEALSKAGIVVAGSELDGNETILSSGTLAMRTGAASSVTAFEREVDLQQHDLDSYAASYNNSCPTGGPSGLICCAQCTASYSRYLSETAKEMETQTVAKVGREVSEMLQLLNDAKMRLQQALEVAEDNDARRSTFGVSEVSLPQSQTHNGAATSRVMDISDIGFDG